MQIAIGIDFPFNFVEAVTELIRQSNERERRCDRGASPEQKELHDRITKRPY